MTGGGLGSVGLASATKVLNTVTFAFASPVCAGANPGAGTGTFFFGLASTKLPKPVTAQVKVQGGAWVNVAARAAKGGTVRVAVLRSCTTHAHCMH